MLSFFRRGGTGQVLVGAIVFAIIVVFVLEFRAGRSGGSGGLTRECALEVYDRCVDRKEYFAAFGLIVPRGMQPKRVRTMRLRQHVMEGLVERELLLEEADRLGVSISEKEIDDELEAGRAHVSLPTAQSGWMAYSLGIGPGGIRLLPVKSVQTDRFDYKIYERIVRNTTNRSPREFKEMMQRELTAERMRDLVRTRVRVSVEEAYTQWERENSKARARIAHIDRAWFESYAVDGSQAALDAWAKDNAQQLDEAWKSEKPNWKPGCFVVSEILVSVASEASEEDKVKKRNQIEAARERLMKKEPFGQVAREVSEGASKSWGGELGCLAESYGPGYKELSDALSKMKPGEISPVLETPRGFHVIRLDKKLGEGDAESVGRQVVARRMALPLRADEKAKAFAQKLIDKLEKGAKLDDDMVKELARELIVTKGPTQPNEEPAALTVENRPRVEVSSPFTISFGGLVKAKPGENPAQAVFDLKKVDDVVKKPIQTESGLAVLQLKEKTPAKRADFDKQKNDILMALREAKQSDAVARYVAALRKSAGDKIKINTALIEEDKKGGEGDDE